MDKANEIMNAINIAEGEINDRDFFEDLGYILSQVDVKNRNKMGLPINYKNEFCKIDIAYLDLTVRSSNVLRRNHINTMGDIMDHFKDLAKYRNCGKASVQEIKEKFLQFWYERLSENQVQLFWEDFIKANGVIQ